MTIQKGICAECGKEYEYEYNPQFPRKYCHECSAAKKASYSPQQQTSTAQPVNAPVVKPETNILDLVKDEKKHTTMYVGYAKDVFAALLGEYKDEAKVYEEWCKKTMSISIELVKQAKEAFI